MKSLVLFLNYYPIVVLSSFQRKDCSEFALSPQFISLFSCFSPLQERKGMQSCTQHHLVDLGSGESYLLSYLGREGTNTWLFLPLTNINKEQDHLAVVSHVIGVQLYFMN